MALVMAVIIVTPEVEAKRFGGGKSWGKSQPTFKKQPSQQLNQQQSPNSGATNTARRPNMMGGLLGGLLAGGLFAGVEEAPGDTIIRIGEVGDALFVIGHGMVDVILKDGNIVAQLYEGQFFGEAALLKETTRNANVRAATYCDLYKLSKESFLEIISVYPELIENMQNITQKRSSDRRAPS